jgi:hypothetical protein
MNKNKTPEEQRLVMQKEENLKREDAGFPEYHE